MICKVFAHILLKKSQTGSFQVHNYEVFFATMFHAFKIIDFDDMWVVYIVIKFLELTLKFLKECIFIDQNSASLVWLLGLKSYISFLLHIISLIDDTYNLKMNFAY